jgi:DNA-binding NtrC family response regulator
MRILIVDDDEIVLKSCSKVLINEGIEVIEVRSAESAFNIITQKELSAILVDIKMPGQDGLNLIKKIRLILPDIPIIVMSGYATMETIKQARDVTSGIFLPKPFTPDELLVALENIIKPSGSSTG